MAHGSTSWHRWPRSLPSPPGISRREYSPGDPCLRGVQVWVARAEEQQSRYALALSFPLRRRGTKVKAVKLVLFALGATDFHLNSLECAHPPTKLTIATIAYTAVSLMSDTHTRLLFEISEVQRLLSKRVAAGCGDPLADASAHLMTRASNTSASMLATGRSCDGGVPTQPQRSVA